MTCPLDAHKGIYAIFQKNLTTGSTETLASVFPGGASRPELSRDGRTLAFVRRVRDKEALVLKYVSSTSPSENPNPLLRLAGICKPAPSIMSGMG